MPAIDSAKSSTRPTRIAALLLGVGLWPIAIPAADLEIGREINEVCAGCHGEFGQGGKGGVYPRLAGQPAAFLEKQLHLFRDRRRPNLAMVEYVDDRQMPDPDITDVAAFLAGIELPTRMSPEPQGEFDALARLLEAKQVLNIARAPGDAEAGERTYNQECRSCHGRDGRGDRDAAVPMLAGQYTVYLWRQVKKYRDGIRIHDEDDPQDELLREFGDDELRDIFAFLSVVDDR